MRRKLIILVITTLLISLILPFNTVIAANYHLDSGTGGSFFNLDILNNGDVLYINTSETVGVTGGSGADIQIVCTVDDVNLEIQDVDIQSSVYAIQFYGGLNNTLLLIGDSVLECTSDYPAIYVPAYVSGPAGLIINDAGGASLTAHGGPGGGPGIGCDYENGGTNIVITINGGTIFATGGEKAAGIGGSDNSCSPTIYINGGTITAYGGYSAAGIGGGINNSCEVYVAGGTVTAIGGEGYDDGGTIYGGGAGIGGGAGGAGEVYISGGSVTAYGGFYYDGAVYYKGGAGIGGGEAALGEVYITGGTINAYAGVDIGGGYHEGGAAAIGSGCDSPTATIEISNAEVNAYGSEHGAGIGGGYASYGEIYIFSGTVTAYGGYGAAGIGGGYDCEGYVEIYGGTVNADGGDGGAGIGGGEYASYSGDAYVYIYGGTINAVGGSSASGIGGGKTGNAYIEIENADITATGGNGTSGTNEGSGAGIGGGDSGYGEVYIDGASTVVAYGGATELFTDTFTNGGAGIGGGFEGNGDVYISDGYVTAYAGAEIDSGQRKGCAAGIGSGMGFGRGGTSAYVEISGGIVTAIASNFGAGIGGGRYSDGEVHITDAAVYATAGRDSAGIGGGDSGTGEVYIHNSTVETFTVEGSEAGIGGGCNSASGEIEIIDSFVIARGGYGSDESAAGIGGGYDSSCTSPITIDNSIVYAQAGSAGADDIGGGMDGSFTDEVQIIGDSAVFLYHDNVCTIGGTLNTTQLHVNSETIVDNSAYGFNDFPDDWNGNTGYGYLVPVTIIYNHNYGSHADEDTATEYIKGLIRQPSPNPSRGGYVFNGWHYFTDGTDPVYFGTTQATADDTFYADWVLMGTDSGKLSGELELDTGAAAPGCHMTLESTPITVTTDSNGDFTFGNVYFINHTLIVRNTSGNIVKSYDLTFIEGSATTASVNDAAGTIDITYTGDVTGVIIPLQLNAAQDDANVNGSVRFTYASSGSVSNPQTGDSSTNYLWFVLALALLFSAMAGAIILKKKTTK